MEVNDDYLFMKKKAEEGDAKAQVFMGRFCINEENYTKAVEWFVKASQQGDALAQSLLVYCKRQT